jgi:DNA-binding response OmpR family regulator
MPERPIVVTFDVDSASLASFRQAFPDWEIKSRDGATAGSLRRDWDPGKADLLVIGARDNVSVTLGLCRGLRSQAGGASTPLLVLVGPGQDALVTEALNAGAHSCLVLPVHAKELVSMVARTLAGNRPGRHTLGLDRAQCEDSWRDEGGEG